MDKSLISIIVPVYNAEKYIDACLDSILSQTYDNIEIILVDDGSTDLSLSRIKSYAEKDARIKIISQKNQGVTRARCNGVSIASGSFICFSDADDILPQDSVENMSKYMFDYDIIVAGVEFVGGYKWPFKNYDKIYSRNTYIKHLITGKIHSGPIAKLFKRELFDERTFSFPSEIEMGEDYLMNLRLANNIKTSVRQIPNVVYTYIQRPTYHPSDRKNRKLRLSYKIQILSENDRPILLLFLQYYTYFMGEIKQLIKGIIKRK